MSTYGIDLGTTNCCIATLDHAGTPRVIHDEENASDTLASAIYIDENDSFLVGAAAKEEAVTHPETTFQFWKRYIGRDDIPDMPVYKANGKEYDPVKLSSILLEKIVRYANASGEDVKDVVITCPAYFNFAQREATKNAGLCAGLNVLAVINEPTAAALYYCANRFQEQSTKVLVYDLGGGTFDVSIIEISLDGETRRCNVLASKGDFMLGGCDWDECLYNLLLQKYSEQYGVAEDAIDDELKREFRGKAEDAKQKLSRKDKTSVKVFFEGEKISVDVTREEFDAATKHKLDQTVSWIDMALKTAGCTDADMDVVLMVGGSTIMPQVRDMLNARFGDKVQFNEPNLAVAKGAALTASMIYEDINPTPSPDPVPGPIDDGNPNNTDNNNFGDGAIGRAKKPSIVLTDVSPSTFGLGILDENGTYICDNIVKVEQTIPCEETRTYYTPQANMRLIRLKLFESKDTADISTPCVDARGQEQYVDPALEMIYRGALELPLPDGYNVPAESEVIVNFSISEACTVKIIATVPAAGNESKEAVFHFAKQMSAEEIQDEINNNKNRIYVEGE